MAKSIEIDYALAGNPLPASGFIAEGSFENDDLPDPPATSEIKLVRTAGPGVDVTGISSFDPLTERWTAAFSALSPGTTYTLSATFAGLGAPDMQENLKVPASDGATLFMAPMPPPPTHPPGPIPVADTMVDYKIEGTYKKGVAVICMLVTIEAKKIKSVDAVASAKLTPFPDATSVQGTWNATLRVKTVEPNVKLAAIALLISEKGRILESVVRRSKKS